MMGDPRTIAQILGSSLIISAIMYIVVKTILDSQTLTGGLWEVGLFLITVIPVVGAIGYIFSGQ